MKKIIYLIIINYQLSTINSSAQNPFHFVKKYGYTNDTDIGYNLLQNHDSTYFVSAYGCSNCIMNPANFKRYLYKIDKYGNQSYYDLFSDSAKSMYNKDMKRNTLGNRIIVAGPSLINAYYSLRYVSEIVVYDTIGNKLHNSMIGDTSIADIRITSILPISENEILFGGDATLDSLTFPNSAKVVIGKIDTLGNILWIKYYPNTQLVYGPFYSMIKDTDGNYIAAGSYWPGNNLQFAKVWLKKIDTNGNEIWDIKPINNAIANSIVSGNDGKPVFCGAIALDVPAGQGNLGTAPMASKISHTGQVLWTYKFTWGNNVQWVDGSEAVRVLSAHGNGYMLFANVYTLFPQPPPGNNTVPLMVKISETGQEIWRKTFGLPNDSLYNDSLNVYTVYSTPINITDAITTSDGGYAAVGKIQSLGDFQVYLLKVNCNGDTASPKAMFNPIINISNNSIVNIYNQSQYFDTCVFMFSDSSPNQIVTSANATFTHTFPGNAADYGITCIAKACNQEWDTTIYTQIITNSYNLKSNQGYLQNPIPNPTNGNTTINYYLPPNTKQACITITNQFGQIVQNQNIANSNNGKLVLQTESLSNGIYLINLVTENGMIGNRKLVVLE